jgi:predicted dehydrogenase
MRRREFLASGAALAPPRTVRVGVIGLGGRGSGLLRVLLSMDNLAFPALCDVGPENLARARAMVEQAGLPMLRNPGWHLTDDRCARRRSFSR